MMSAKRLTCLTVTCLLLAWPGLGRGVLAEEGPAAKVGWSPEERRTDPAGFIDYAATTLVANRAALAAAKVALQQVLGRLEELRAATERKAEWTVRQTEVFEQAGVQASIAGKWPVSIEGRDYTRDELFEEMRRLRDRKYREQGFAIVGVSEPVGKNLLGETEEEAEKVPAPDGEMDILDAWIADTEAGKVETPWPLGLILEGGEKERWAFYKIPGYCIVDRKGVYRYFRQGLEDECFEILDQVIAKLLAEK